MSVEYSLATGYGMRVSEENVLDMCNHLTPEDEDTFRDYWCRQLNSWTGGDYFLGVIDDLGDSDCIPVSNLGVDKKELEQFTEFMVNHGLTDWVTWNPKYYILQFCY